jgi:hypothetical protein
MEWDATQLKQLESYVDSIPGVFGGILVPLRHSLRISDQNAIIQPDILVDKNKKIWKMKIPLKIKIFSWYLVEG